MIKMRLILTRDWRYEPAPCMIDRDGTGFVSAPDAEREPYSRIYTKNSQALHLANKWKIDKTAMRLKIGALVDVCANVHILLDTSTGFRTVPVFV
jgi:hypothetical protein